jgi:hypothetical protein
MKTLTAYWQGLKRWYRDHKHQAYITQAEKTTIKEMKVICAYFEIPLARTHTWEIYQWPYKPLVREPDGWEELEAIIRVKESPARRTRLYQFMVKFHDITPVMHRRLRCSEHYHDFMDWFNEER